MTSPQRQPLLHDLSVTLAAPTVVLSEPDGNLDAAAPGAGVHGLFHADIRALSLLRVTLRPDHAPSGEHAGKAPPAAGGDSEAEGEAEDTGTRTDEDWLPVVAAMNAADGPGRSRFVGLAQALGDAVPDPTVRVDRQRTVTPGRLAEQLTVRSSATKPVHLAIRVEVAGDLVTLEHAKAGLPPRSPAGPSSELLSDAGVLRWGDHAVAVAVSAPGATPDAEHSTLTWTLTVKPGENVDLHLAVEVSDTAAVVTAAGHKPTWQRPHVTADDRRLPALVSQSLDDLHSLRMATAASPGDTFLAAGIPWFFTLFGRDSLWAARMLLPLGTDLALGTLRTLAAQQGTRTDPATEEEPGKILHEIRRGLFDDGQGLRLPPVYYGTVDATPLWICLLHDAWRWGLPTDDVEPLLPALTAALGWIDAAAQAGDGFLSYIDHTGTGLANQGWKDSGDAARYADGRLAEAPSLSPKYRATPTRQPSPARHCSTPSGCRTANAGGPSRPTSPTGSAPGSGSPTSTAPTPPWHSTAQADRWTRSRATWATSWPPASSTPTRVPPSPHASPPRTCPTPTACAPCRPRPAASARCATTAAPSGPTTPPSPSPASPAPDTPKQPPGSSKASSPRRPPSTTACRNCGAATPARTPPHPSPTRPPASHKPGQRQRPSPS